MTERALTKTDVIEAKKRLDRARAFASLHAHRNTVGLSDEDFVEGQALYRNSMDALHAAEREYAGVFDRWRAALQPPIQTGSEK